MTGNIGSELLRVQIDSSEHIIDDTSDSKTIWFSASVWRRAQQCNNNILPAASKQEQLTLQLLGCPYIDARFGSLRFASRTSAAVRTVSTMETNPKTISASAWHYTTQRIRGAFNSVPAKSSWSFGFSVARPSHQLRESCASWQPITRCLTHRRCIFALVSRAKQG
jgi:hypothetical protein